MSTKCRCRYPSCGRNIFGRDFRSILNVRFRNAAPRPVVKNTSALALFHTEAQLRLIPDCVCLRRDALLTRKALSDKPSLPVRFRMTEVAVVIMLDLGPARDWISSRSRRPFISQPGAATSYSPRRLPLGCFLSALKRMADCYTIDPDRLFAAARASDSIPIAI